MARRRVMAAALVATALGLGVAAWWLRPPPADPTPVDPRVPRVVLATSGGWSDERIEAGLAAGDALPGDVDVGDLLERATPTEAMLVAFHAANPDVFGGRPYLQSRSAAETLLKVHLVRRPLGLPDPPTGVVWPEDVSPGGAP